MSLLCERRIIVETYETFKLEMERKGWKPEEYVVIIKDMEMKPEFVYAETEIQDGNMFINWGAKNIGFGQLQINVLEDGKLIMYTECMGKEFVKSLFDYIVENSHMG
jgi:hypothetical protein